MVPFSCFLLFDTVILYLLKVIAAVVVSDPDKYSEAFLGKPNDEYVSWILNPEKWGGALIILHFLLSHVDELHCIYFWLPRYGLTSHGY